MDFDLATAMTSLGFPVWALVVLYGVIILKHFADGLISTIKELSGELSKLTLEHGVRIAKTETRLDYHDKLIEMKADIVKVVKEHREHREEH